MWKVLNTLPLELRNETCFFLRYFIDFAYLNSDVSIINFAKKPMKMKHTDYAFATDQMFLQ